MSTSIRDQTTSFRQTVREIALRQGFDQERLKQITSSWLLPPVVSRSPFIATAKEILRNIRTLELFILQNKRDYLDRFRSSEAEKDDIEHQVGLFVRTCRELIDVLKDSITLEHSSKHSLSWIGGLGGGGGGGGDGTRRNSHVNAHQHGVVLILSERLHAVTAAFDKLRSVRFQEAFQRSSATRRAGLRSALQETTHSVRVNTATTKSGPGAEDGRIRRDGDVKEVSQQQMLLDEETKALQVELSSLADSVRDTESRLLEVSALGHLFSTHVLQQAQQIERLYKDAVEASHNVDMGNKEIVKTISRNSHSRVFLLLFMTVLTLTILFLDWYK